MRAINKRKKYYNKNDENTTNHHFHSILFYVKVLNRCTRLYKFTYYIILTKIHKISLVSFHYFLHKQLNTC